MENFSTVSLEQRYKQKIASIFIGVLIALSLFLFGLNYYQNVQQHQQVVQAKQLTVQTAFSSYIDRAETELKHLSHVLAQETAINASTISLLLPRQEAFLYGGVDFFYLEQRGQTPILDPRMPLFVQSLDRVFTVKHIERWQLVLTSDNDYFLVYKKHLYIDGATPIGFLYGFIALRNNIALTSALMNSAQLQQVRLVTDGGEVLFDERTMRDDSDDILLSTPIPLSLFGNPMTVQLQVGISYPPLLQIFYETLYQALLLSVAFLVAYSLLSRWLDILICRPLAELESGKVVHFSEYKEIKAIQSVFKGQQAAISDRVRSLELLMTNSQLAIIFCDEVASALNMNAEAKGIFPDSERTRTIFDFMPPNCHAFIHQALRGEIGGCFDMSVPAHNKIYVWSLYPYIVESGFRGLVMIGRDVTREQQLEWQLAQLQPAGSHHLSQIEMPLIAEELTFLVEQWHYRSHFELGVWLESLMGLLNALTLVPEERTSCPLGELICQEFSRVTDNLNHHSVLEFECRLESACIHSQWSSDVTLLLRGLIMWVHSSALVERKRISFQTTSNRLTICVLGISSARSIYTRIVERVADRLNATMNPIEGRGMELLIPFTYLKLESVAFAPKTRVAWIANGYVKQTNVLLSLQRLGVEVDSFHSVNAFFFNTQRAEYTAVLIGDSNNNEAYDTLRQSLAVRLNRTDFPIAIIGSGSQIDAEFRLEHCPFEYNIAKLLRDMQRLEPILMDYAIVDGNNWLIVGGSTVGRAILRSELTRNAISPYIASGLDNCVEIVRNNAIKVVLLLEEVPLTTINELQELFPALLLVSVNNKYDGICLPYKLDTPYQSDSIASLMRFITDAQTKRKA